VIVSVYKAMLVYRLVVLAVQSVTVPGQPSLSQGVQTHHQVTAVLLARHYYGLPQHVHAYFRAPSPAAVARQASGSVYHNSTV